MRILFATNDPIPPFRHDVLTLFGKYGMRLGLAVDLWAQRKEPGASQEGRWLAGKTFACGKSRFGFLNQAIRFFDSLRIFFINLNDYHAIQVRDRPITACFWLLAAKVKRKPFFYWMSYPDDIGYWMLSDHCTGFKKYYYFAKGCLMHGLLRWIVFPFSDYAFVQSDKLKSMISDRYHIDSDKMTSVPMGVDMEMIDHLRQLPVKEEAGREKILVYLGAMEAVRGLEILMDTLVILKHASGVAFRLWMIGGASDNHVEQLKHYAKVRGVSDCIEWLGWLPADAAWEKARAADIALSMIPPIFDFSSPTKVIEYLAVGLPVIASAEIDDQRKVVTESGGGVCVSFDANECALAICQLFSDDSLLHQMKMAGPPYVSTHRSYTILAEQVVRVYQKILSC